MRRLARYFFQGLLFAAPAWITMLVLYWLFNMIDEPVRSLFHLQTIGVGFVIAFIVGVPLLTIIGFLSSNLLTHPLMQLADQQFDRFPLIKLFHSSLKDLLGSFVGKKKRFNRPVLVSAIPQSDLKFVGFVTCATMESWGLKDQVAVYIPAAFNFGGNLVVVPKECVRPVDKPTPDVMAFVFSGGIAGERKPAAEPPAAQPPAAAPAAK
ncbi:MAG: DUF502 domain-containing protein [Candidatus Brocadiia bacterium]|jgi:uncharacterized membrane protein